MKNVNQIVKRLKEEVAHCQPVVDGEEEISDGTENIIAGRHELAEGLLDWIQS